MGIMGMQAWRKFDGNGLLKQELMVMLVPGSSDDYEAYDSRRHLVSSHPSCMTFDRPSIKGVVSGSFIAANAVC